MEYRDYGKLCVYKDGTVFYNSNRGNNPRTVYHDGGFFFGNNVGTHHIYGPSAYYNTSDVTYHLGGRPLSPAQFYTRVKTLV